MGVLTGGEWVVAWCERERCAEVSGVLVGAGCW